jgi:trehalose-6-phosphate synthase
MKAFTIIFMGISLSACGGESDEAQELADQFEQAIEAAPSEADEAMEEMANEVEGNQIDAAAAEIAEEAVEAMGDAAANFEAMMEDLEQAED